MNGQLHSYTKNLNRETCLKGNLRTTHKTNGAPKSEEDYFAVGQANNHLKK